MVVDVYFHFLISIIIIILSLYSFFRKKLLIIIIIFLFLVAGFPIRTPAREAFCGSLENNENEFREKIRNIVGSGDDEDYFSYEDATEISDDEVEHFNFRKRTLLPDLEIIP